ncbi:MAG: carbon-nitrogen hydrolase family protein [Baekduia sp.]
MTATTIRLGVVQPQTRWGEDEPQNLDHAIAYVGQAAALGVDLLAFPENHPGPYTAGRRYEVVDPMCAAAKEHGIAVMFGTSFEVEGRPGHCEIAHVFAREDGTVAGICPRTHPVGPYIYEGGELWDFSYEESDQFTVVDLGFGTVGVVTCSEAFVPEVARVMAKKGAELCIFPSGILIDELGYTDNWRTLVRARAIENLMYTAVTVNLFDLSLAAPYRQAEIAVPPSASGLSRGIAMICSPERVLAQSEAPGILTADLDFARIRELRATEEELIIPAPYATIPGITGWARPMIYDELRRLNEEESRP